ncbi:Uncharacterised protein [Streptococcus pneumoniae]|nr:Uncharacterised protein [Streptococcus pneumoniae]
MANSLLKANVKALIAVFEELYPSVLIGCVSPLANIVSEAMSVVTFIILPLLEFFNNGKKACIIWKVPKKLTSNPWRKVSIFNSLGSTLKSSAMPALLINKCK